MKLKWPAVIAIAFLLLFVVAIYRLASAPLGKAQPVAIPQPNAYDTLVQAGRQVIAVPKDFDSTDNLDVLKQCLVDNAGALALIDQSLEQGYLVHFDNAPGLVMSSQELARVLRVQSRVAQMEGRLDDAADPLVKIVLMGERLDDGGGILNSLAAMAVEEMGATSLKSMVDQLSDTKKVELLVKLEPAIGGAEDIDRALQQVVDREEEFASESQSVITGWWSRFASRDSMHRPMQITRQTMQSTERRRKELLEALQNHEVTTGED